MCSYTVLIFYGISKKMQQESDFWMVTLSKPGMLEPVFMLVLWHRVVL